MKHCLILALALMAATRPAQAQYTFGPEVQSTNTANLTYNSGTGFFQYTDAANLSDDFAGVFLTGNAANSIATSNGWTASLTANLSARSMPGNGFKVNAAMALFVIINNNTGDSIRISLNQQNNTGSGVNLDLYGTLVLFEAQTNNLNLATTPLGSSGNNGGTSFQQLSGATNASATVESINAATGLLSFTNDASTGILTGYYNGAPVGSISLASWGPNPSLSLAVAGYSDYGIIVPANTDTASNFFAGVPLQILTTALPNATNGAAYSQTLTASGGQTPYSWTNSSGVLPTNLTLATNGLISGTPTTNGTFHFTAKLTDATNGTATQPLTLTVFTPPSVALQPTNPSVAVTVGSAVSFTASAAGTGPFTYQWQLNGTNLPNSLITTVAGNGTPGFSGDGGAATNAEFDHPSSVAVDAAGNLFIADYLNSRVRKVGTNGIITTVAGTNAGGFFGDGGAASNAELSLPYGVAVDASGNLFIADDANYRVREVGTNGIINTVAGGGVNSPGDGGAATNATLGPFAVAVDASSNLFIADVLNQRIRKVGTNGIITTVAGNGTNALSGDGGPATNAELFGPFDVVVDAIGNVFIADDYNQRIRKVGINGIITTLAGNGSYSNGNNSGGYSGDGGAATNAALNFPTGVVVDATGNVFIADSGNSRIREVGTNGIITTVVGTNTGGYSGDGGAATNAELDNPAGVTLDAAGNLFIADTDNNRIRKVVNPGASALGPTLALNDVGFKNAGAYDVVVAGPYSSVTSTVVNLTVTLPLILSAPQLSGGNTNFTFLLSGPAGSNYVLQLSTDLVNWSSFSTSSIPLNGSLSLSNAINGFNRRFYRAYLP